MAKPLDGAWQKLKWAQRHIDALRKEIGELDPDPLYIPLRRQYEPDKSAIVWHVERVPEIRDSWGLVTGDALHNFRCTLDHLWWQLAKWHLKREPTEDEAKDIQFPIYEQHWNPKHRYLRHVDPAHAAKVEARQPFNPPTGDEINYLGVLRRLSNTDKHRVIHPVLVSMSGSRLPTPVPEAFIDCKPARVEIQGKWVMETRFTLGGSPKVGDKIFELPVIVTGDDPDVDFDTDLTCRVAFSEDSLDLISTLDGIAAEVTAILTSFDSVFP
jgi:hypothetical protein